MKRLWLATVVLPLMGITVGIGSPMAHAADTPLVIDTTSIDFGNVNVGSTSPQRAAVIKNTGGQSFGPLHIFGGAPPSPQFGATQNCNGATLAPGGTCSVSYTFSPTAPGALTDTSNFIISATPSQADGEAFSVSLSGTGVNPITATPLSHAFGNVNVGSTSTPMATVITNNSGQSFGPLHIFGGAPPNPQFGATQNCNGATLAPGGTCSVSYTFSPTAPGALTDTSNFIISGTPSQAAGTAFSVSLSGCGVPPGKPCPSAATTTTLQSSVNPSVFGQQVTFTATVDAPSTPTVPAGTVKFVDATAGATLATVALDSNGQATLTTAALAVGSHAIQATYAPSSAAFASSIGSLTQVVKPPTPGGGGGDNGLPVTGSKLPTTLAWQGALIIAVGAAMLMLARLGNARAIASLRAHGNAQASPPEGADDRA